VCPTCRRFLDDCHRISGRVTGCAIISMEKGSRGVIASASFFSAAK
jgi:hypothetical protein